MGILFRSGLVSILMGFSFGILACSNNDVSTTDDSYAPIGGKIDNLDSALEVPEAEGDDVVKDYVSSPYSPNDSLLESDNVKDDAKSTVPDVYDPEKVINDKR